MSFKNKHGIGLIMKLITLNFDEKFITIIFVKILWKLDKCYRTLTVVKYSMADLSILLSLDPILVTIKPNHRLTVSHQGVNLSTAKKSVINWA